MSKSLLTFLSLVLIFVFTPASSIAETGDSPVFVQGDFDGDGERDVIEMNRTTGALYRYGEVAKAYQAVGYWDVGASWSLFVVGDFTGDGSDDFAARRDDNGLWFVASLKNNSFEVSRFGRWSKRRTFVNIVSGDFDGNGISDVAGRIEANGKWIVSLSNGERFENSRWGRWSPKKDWIALSGDFNGDGKDDIAGMIRTNGRWRVALSDGVSFASTNWGRKKRMAELEMFASGDFDGDGRDEIVAYDDFTPPQEKRFLVYADPSDSGFTFSVSGRAILLKNSNLKDVYVFDSNNDGKEDIIGRAVYPLAVLDTVPNASHPTVWLSLESSFEAGNGSSNMKNALSEGTPAIAETETPRRSAALEFALASSTAPNKPLPLPDPIADILKCESLGLADGETRSTEVFLQNDIDSDKREQEIGDNTYRVVTVVTALISQFKGACTREGDSYHVSYYESLHSSSNIETKHTEVRNPYTWWDTYDYEQKAQRQDSAEIVAVGNTGILYGSSILSVDARGSRPRHNGTANKPVIIESDIEYAEFNSDPAPALSGHKEEKLTLFFNDSGEYDFVTGVPDPYIECTIHESGSHLPEPTSTSCIDPNTVDTYTKIKEARTKFVDYDTIMMMNGYSVPALPLCAGTVLCI